MELDGILSCRDAGMLIRVNGKIQARRYSHTVLVGCYTVEKWETGRGPM